MNSCGVWLGEAVVERDDDELLHPEPGDQLGLGVEAGEQLRGRLGPDDRSGCGSNVSTVSLPGITSRWPRWTPSNSPTAIRRGRGSASSSSITRIGGEA